jgi:hypothetical protein
VPDQPGFLVLLFQSLTLVMRAERLLLADQVPHRTVPTPKRLSSECGVSIRIQPADQERALRALAGKVAVSGLRAAPA